MTSLIETPFKLSLEEILCSAAITVLLNALSNEGSPQVNLEQLCFTPQYGFTASASSIPCGPQLVRITDIKEGRIDWNTVPYCECPDPDNYQLYRNDILIARAGSIGKSFIVKEISTEAVFASYMIRLRVKQEFHPEYIYWCLQSQQFWAQIMEAQRGSAMKNINAKMISSLKFPVPSLEMQSSIIEYLNSFQMQLQGSKNTLPQLPPLLEEQHRIVARIEELAAKIEEARGLRLETVEETKILLSSSQTKFFKDAPQQNIHNLSDLAILERGKFSHRPRNDSYFFGGEHPWIQIGEIGQTGKYIKTWTETLNDEGLKISRKFPKGTLLISIAATIGAVGILDFDCCIPDSIVAVTPKTGVDSEYLYHYFGYIRSHLETVAPQSAQKNINLEILSSLPIPLFELDRQKDIIIYLNNLQARINILARRQAETAAELDALLPSILNKAFKGEL